MIIEKQILLMSYWEHMKLEKELAKFYNPDHPKRILLKKHVESIVSKLNSEPNPEPSVATKPLNE